MERKPMFEFAEWVVEQQGKLVKEARQKGKELGLSELDVRVTLLTAFQTLGETSGLTLRGLSQRIRHK